VHGGYIFHFVSLYRVFGNSRLLLSLNIFQTLVPIAGNLSYVTSWVTKVCTMELVTHYSYVSATPLPAILWVPVLLWIFQRDPWVLSTPALIPVYGHEQVVCHEAAHQESCLEQPVGQAVATIHTSALYQSMKIEAK
jgi:hypothetical protein